MSALRGLAKAHDRLGDLDKSSRLTVAAEKHYQVAQEVRTRLQLQRPTDLIVGRDLAVSLGKMADIQYERGALKEARDGFLNELATLQSIKEAGGDKLLSLRDFRFVQGRLGLVCTGMLEYEAARQHYEQALAHARTLEAAGAADGPVQVGLALEWLGITALRAGDTAEAVLKFEECLALRRRIAADAPGNAEALRGVCTVLYNLGDCHFQARNLDKARARYQEALAVYEQLASSDVGSLKRQLDLFMTLVQLSIVENCAERFAQVATLQNQLLAGWRALEKKPEAAHLQPAVVVKIVGSAVAGITTSGPSGFRLADVAKGLEGDLRAGLLMARSIYLARRGQHEEAVRLADQVVQLPQGKKYLNGVARCHALCAEAVERAATPLSSEMRAVRDNYENQALRYLEESIQALSPNPNIIVVNPDWNAIRQHPSFNNIIWSVLQVTANSRATSEESRLDPCGDL